MSQAATEGDQNLEVNNLSSNLIFLLSVYSFFLDIIKKLAHNHKFDSQNWSRWSEDVIFRKPRIQQRHNLIKS